MNKKWLIGIVVVAAVGVLVYLGTNTDLFKGALRGGEKGGLPSVTEKRCTMIIQKLNTQGLMSSEWKYYDSCLYNYPSLFPVPEPTPEVAIANCKFLKKSLDSGTLSKDQNNLAKAHKCAKDYPAIWYGPNQTNGCKQLKQWYKEGTMTQNLSDTGITNEQIETCQGWFE